jgi:hypothetical protein
VDLHRRFHYRASHRGDVASMRPQTLEPRLAEALLLFIESAERKGCVAPLVSSARDGGP